MRFLALLLSLVLALPVQAQFVPQPPSVAAKSWLLLEFASGQILASQGPDERVEPASLTKLMTAYLTFAAVRDKKLSLQQVLPVSERARKTGGSRMFVDEQHPATVEQLIRGMIIQSGNDACVVLAEAIAGSEETFAQLMNREAERLGMKSSRFTNSTGLTDANHYTTTRDLSILASALIRDFPEFYPIYSEKEYRFNNITQANRNRLLYTDPTVDGVKTGHTEAAGWCLIASAKRDSRRLLSVVVGTASDSVRAQESQKLLNYGYQFYDFVKVLGKDQPAAELRLWKAARNTVKVGMTRDFGISVPKGSGGKVTTNVVPAAKHQIGAVAAGQPLATLQVLVDGKVDSEHPLVALEAVEEAGWFGKLWDSLLLLFQ